MLNNVPTKNLFFLGSILILFALIPFNFPIESQKLSTESEVADFELKETEIPKEKAVSIVRELPEVKKFLREVSPSVQADRYKNFIMVEEEERPTDMWTVVVATIVKDSGDISHQTTFNRYMVDKFTGEIICSFFIYEGGRLIRASEPHEFPCY